MLHSPSLDPTTDLITPTEPSAEHDIMPPHEPHLPDQPVLRQSTRVSKPLPHLADFHCHAVTNQYDISHYVNYSWLSPSYKNFICQVSARDVKKTRPRGYRQRAGMRGKFCPRG